MQTFPMLLKMAGRSVVFVGGGEEIVRKVRLILRTEARILIVAPDPDAELRALIACGRASRAESLAPELFEGAALAFIATGDDARDARAAAMARSAGVPVNVVDRHAPCDTFTPSIVDRGFISLVGAGPGARDLLTLRAVQKLQEADVIFYDRLVDPELLDLARRDAERVFVGKEVSGTAWPQDRINGVIVAAARQGQRVVRLKSGDPGIFGRACEEIAAARAAGIGVEIVPGVTAASAAAAALGRPLTERGETDRLVIATGTCRPGDAAPDWGAMLAPGTTLALYMAMGRLAEVAASLRAAGLPEATGVEIVSEASTAREQRLSTTLARLVADVAQSGLKGPAIVFARRLKTAAALAKSA